MDGSLNPFPNIYEKIKTRERLTLEDGVRLFQSTDVLALGELAQMVRQRLHGKRVYYSTNLHLNHTNICPVRCDFCAFSRSSDETDAYALTLDEIEKRIGNAVRQWDINEIHMVGGHNPDLPLDYYVELFQRVRKKFPQIHIKALSAPEIDDLSKRSNLSVSEILRMLQDAGLGSIPGGGAEIFEPKVRRQLCPRKITGEEWLQVHETAHQLGIPTNVTMLYGHRESDEDRIEHLLAIRNLQDKTGGFRSFVPLAYHPQNERRATTGFLDLKILSISRLMLDNIPHIKVHWPATDLKFAQAALSFGVDDIGGTNFDERVMRLSGGHQARALSSSDLVRLITDAGYEPRLVDSSYSALNKKGLMGVLRER